MEVINEENTPKKRRTTRKKATVICVIGVIACILAAGAMTAAWMYKSGFELKETTYIYIDADDDVDSVSQKIADATKPQSMKAFHLFANALSLKEKIRTGRYEVIPDMTMLQLIRNIRNHHEKPVNLIVPSVRAMGAMAKNLSNQLMIDSASIANYMNNESHLEALGFTKENLFAFFIPNTYEVYWDIKVEDLFKRLKRENDAFWNEERMAKLAEVSEYAGEEMTKEKVATLASIVDSETANNGEKPDIAALYMNRMRIKMPLQSDPTVIFALQDFTIRRVLHEHLKVDSPYNTYKYAGLPPGAIRVPSIAGMDAVLNHAKNNYIYMCAKEDFSGTHNFAVTYSEHQKNAARYVKALNQRGIH